MNDKKLESFINDQEDVLRLTIEEAMELLECRGNLLLIEADGSDYEINVTTKTGITDIIMGGHKEGTLIGRGVYDFNLVRKGRGDGSVIHLGTCIGDVTRIGIEAEGDAIRGYGHGNATVKLLRGRGEAKHVHGATGDDINISFTSSGMKESITNNNI